MVQKYCLNSLSTLAIFDQKSGRRRPIPTLASMLLSLVEKGLRGG